MKKIILHFIIIFLTFSIWVIAWNQYPHPMRSIWDFSEFNVFEYSKWTKFSIKTRICNNTNTIFEGIYSNIVSTWDKIEPEKCSRYSNNHLWDFYKYYKTPYIHINTFENNIRNQYQAPISPIFNFKKNGKYTININELVVNDSETYTRNGRIRYKMTKQIWDIKNISK